MIVVDDDGGTGGDSGRSAPSSLGRAPGLGQATRPDWRGGGAPSLGPSWPVFSADEYDPCWACDRV
jgi:hypothetical protein